jgi:aryl-alcohol dehydrogenase-like predicted oxidoreductase
MLKWIMHLNRGQFFDTAEMYSIPANENLQEYRENYRSWLKKSEEEVVLASKLQVLIQFRLHERCH